MHKLYRLAFESFMYPLSKVTKQNGWHNVVWSPGGQKVKGRIETCAAAAAGVGLHVVWLLSFLMERLGVLRGSGVVFHLPANRLYNTTCDNTRLSGITCQEHQLTQHATELSSPNCFDFRIGVDIPTQKRPESGGSGAPPWEH